MSSSAHPTGSERRSAQGPGSPDLGGGRAALESAEAEERVREALGDLARLRGRRCAGCSGSICGHDVVFSLALGFKDSPRCLPCLAASVRRDPAALRGRLREHVGERACWTAAWAEASRIEDIAPEGLPPCLASPGAACRDAPAVAGRGAEGGADVEWDAGETSCGDLVLELRIRMAGLRAGERLRLVARDPGARADIPAWCGLTGHRLVRAEPPEFLIERKED